MTATTDEALASAHRELEFDSKAAADVLQERAVKLAQYHSAILMLARPVIRDLIAMNAAVLEAVTGERAGDREIIDAVSMTLDDPRLSYTLPARIAAAHVGVAKEVAQRHAARNPAADVDGRPARANA